MKLLSQILSVGLFFSTVLTALADCEPVVGFGSSISICTGNSLVLNAQNPGADFLWSTGARTQSITVNSSGSYWVRVTNACGTASDTVQVYVDQPHTLNFGSVLGLCPNSPNPLKFQMPNGNYSYLWSTGSTDSEIDITQPGKYWGRLTNACGTYSDTFEVVISNAPVFSLGDDTTVCANARYALSVPSSLGAVSWNTGSSANRIVVTSTGWYSARVTNDCGTHEDSVYITVLPSPPHIIPSEIGKCSTDPVTIDAFANLPPNTTVTWSNGNTGNTATYTNAGTHQAIIKGPCHDLTVKFVIQEVFPQQIDLGPDSSLCGEYMASVDVNGPAEILWSNGADGEMTEFFVSGKYWVSVTNACGAFSDTIELDILFPPDIDFGGDTVFYCPDGPPTVLAPAMADSSEFEWSTGDTSFSIEVTESGWYSLHAENRCGEDEDSIYVRVPDPLSPFTMPDDMAFCEGGSVLIDATDTNATEYHWYRDGVRFSGEDSVRLTQTGSYRLIKNNACDTLQSNVFELTVFPLPRQILPDTIYECAGQNVRLEAHSAGDYYRWNTGETSPFIDVTSSGLYTVEIRNDCDTIIDSVMVRFEQPIPQFTPSGKVYACRGPVRIEAPVGGLRYRWGSGRRLRDLSVNHTGTYWVDMISACDTVRDTIEVEITGPPRSLLGTYVVLCNGLSLVIDAQNPGSTYNWNTGENTRQITVSDAGWYYVDIENDCGYIRDSIEVIVVFPIELDLGPDTVLCEGDVYVLDAFSPHSRYSWNTGDTTSQLQVTQTGMYAVRADNACGARYDSVFVEFLGLPVFNMGDSVPICRYDGSAELSGPEGYLYKWSNGDSLRSIIVDEVGWVWLEVDNGCFTYRDSIRVYYEYPLEIDLGADRVICETEQHFLNPLLSQEVELNWHDGTRGRQFLVRRSGLQHVWGQNTCGRQADSVMVLFDRLQMLENIDSVICLFDTLQLDFQPRLNPGNEVFWWDGDTGKQRGFYETGEYAFVLETLCGDQNYQVSTRVDNCDCYFYIPNTFSPNGDGINDHWKYGFDCYFIKFDLRIYNRWGNEVYQTNDPEAYWDGRAGGQTVPIGVYQYIVNYSWEIYGTEIKRSKSGRLLVIR